MLYNYIVYIIIYRLTARTSTFSSKKKRGNTTATSKILYKNMNLKRKNVGKKTTQTH